MIERLLNSNVFLMGLEAAGLILAVVLSFSLKEQRWLSRLEQASRQLANRRVFSVLITGGAVVIGRLALLPAFPVPVPGVHDEFSYLLNGATFALGRLTNPPSPMWPFFESFHIIQQPTYASMYPVASGLFLAAGFRAGLPWLGVLLAMAIFCSAVTWALQGWVSPVWALIAGILAVIKFGLVSYWIDSYWGGGVPALGGALVIGAIPRLIASAKVTNSIVLAIGLLILANSRPFEGLIVATVSLGWLVAAILRNPRVEKTIQLYCIAVPVCSVLLIGSTLMGVYFAATTGSPVKMPYVRYAEQYSITPAFWWQSTRSEPVFRNSAMRSYYEREVPEYTRAHTLFGWSLELYHKAASFAMFYLWPGVLLVSLTIVKAVRTAAGGFALLLIGAVMAAISVEVWPMMLHYPAPATAATLLLLICCLQVMRRLQVGHHHLGMALSRAVPLICLAALSLRVTAAFTGVKVPAHGLISFLTVSPGNLDRLKVISRLERLPGHHLVIVRYGPNHDLSQEWIYNDPSITTSRIIWARDMGPAANDQLARHFSGRTVWLLEPDNKPLLVRSYVSHPTQPSSFLQISR